MISTANTLRKSQLNSAENDSALVTATAKYDKNQKRNAMMRACAVGAGARAGQSLLLLQFPNHTVVDGIHEHKRVRTAKNVHGNHEHGRDEVEKAHKRHERRCKQLRFPK